MSMGENLKNTAYLLLLLLVYLALSYQVPSFELSSLDDTIMISEQLPRYREFSFVLEIFQDDVFLNSGGSYYRPMQQLWLMLSANVFPFEVFGFKGFFYSTLITFFLAICAFYTLLLKLSFKPFSAFVLALFVLIHPTLVPAWAWIPGMIDAQLTLYTLLAILALHLKSKLRFILHLFFYALALLTKESAILIPAVALFYDTLIIQQKSFSLSQLTSIKTLFFFVLDWIKQHIGPTIGYSFVVIFYFVLRKNALPDNEVNNLLLLNRLGWSPFHFVYLVGSWLFPVGMATYRNFSPSESLLYLPGFLLILFALWKSPVSAQRKVLFALWTIAFYLPASLADKINFHRNFIPIFGLAFLLPLNFIEQTFRTYRKTLLFGLFLFATLTWGFKHDFATQHNFWQSVLNKSPQDPMGLRGKAIAFYNEENYSNSYQYFEKGFSADTTNITGLLGMAAINQINQEYTLCDSLLEEAFLRAKDKQEVESYRGEIYLDRKMPELALDAFKKAKTHYQTNGYLEHKIDSLEKILILD